MPAAELVDLVTESRAHCGTVLRSGQRISKPQHGPVARGNIPAKLAGCVHSCGKIDDIALRYRGRLRSSRCRRRIVLEQKAESRLVFPSMNPRGGVEHEFSQRIFF